MDVEPSVSRAAGSIISIQILRALAAISVLMFHIPLELSNRLDLHDVVPQLLIGAAGVDLFFRYLWLHHGLCI